MAQHGVARGVARRGGAQGGRRRQGGGGLEGRGAGGDRGVRGRAGGAKVLRRGVGGAGVVRCTAVAVARGGATEAGCRASGGVVVQRSAGAGRRPGVVLKTGAGQAEGRRGSAAAHATPRRRTAGRQELRQLGTRRGHRRSHQRPAAPAATAAGPRSSQQRASQRHAVGAAGGPRPPCWRGHWRRGAAVARGGRTCGQAQLGGFNIRRLLPEARCGLQWKAQKGGAEDCRGAWGHAPRVLALTRRREGHRTAWMEWRRTGSGCGQSRFEGSGGGSGGSGSILSVVSAPGTARRQQPLF